MDIDYEAHILLLLIEDIDLLFLNLNKMKISESSF